MIKVTNVFRTANYYLCCFSKTQYLFFHVPIGGKSIVHSENRNFFFSSVSCETYLILNICFCCLPSDKIIDELHRQQHKYYQRVYNLIILYIEINTLSNFLTSSNKKVFFNLVCLSLSVCAATLVNIFGLLCNLCTIEKFQQTFPIVERFYIKRLHNHT